jgi:hypothetical protein
MGLAARCPYLREQSGVAICAAFTGGLRTPRESELFRLCRREDHERCLHYLRHEEAETSRLSEPAGFDRHLSDPTGHE